MLSYTVFFGNYIFQNTNFVRNVVLCYIFAKLFHVWLHKRQLGSQLCFCIRSVAISRVRWSLEPHSQQVWENKSKRQMVSSMIVNIV